MWINENMNILFVREIPHKHNFFKNIESKNYVLSLISEFLKVEIVDRNFDIKSNTKKQQ